MTMNPVAAEAVGDTDAVLRALADERRRTILRSLEGAAGNERPVKELVGTVVEGLGGIEPNERPSRQTIRTEFHHNHLPTLEETGLVVHDREDDVVWSDASEPTMELIATIEEYEATR